MGIDLIDRVEVANRKRECKGATHEGHSGVGVRERQEYSWGGYDSAPGRMWASAGASGDSEGPCCIRRPNSLSKGVGGEERSLQMI